MRLKKLYSNIESFRDISFNDKFSIIVGKAVKTDDISHNLGKTTVLNLIKFILFNGSGSFLNYVKEKEPESIFSIDYVENNINKTFYRGFNRRKNNEPKEIETLLNYDYFIRTQDELDTTNGFIKPTYRGKDITWKPKIASILGFDGNLLTKKLQLMEDCKKLETAINALRSIQSNKLEKENKIKELQAEKDNIEKSIENLTLFSTEDEDINKLVKSIDEEIFKIKSQIYVQKTELRKIENSLEKLNKHQFDSMKIESIFNQVNLYFENQIKHNFAELKTFYEEIYSNRRIVLDEKFKRVNEIIHSLEENATILDLKRASYLESLANVDSVQIYELKHKQLIDIEKEIAILSQTQTTTNIAELEKQYSEKQTEELKTAAEVATNIDRARMQFDEINSIYRDIMKSVLGIESELKINKHKTGNISFDVQSYNLGSESAQLNGDSAKKLSAAAIDIAIRCIRNDDHGFIAQDGIIDALDKNSAASFINKIKELINKYDFQYITTALREKLPDNIPERDIVIELNDSSDEGLLFGFKF